MAPDTAGSSKEPTQEELKKAVDKYEQGVQHLRDGKLEVAVDILGEALQLRIKTHGDLAPECAPFYYRYGEALFHKAQAETDVFGADLQKTSEARPQDIEEDAEVAEDRGHGKAQDDEKENVDTKGKAPMAEEDIAAEEEDAAQEEADEDEDAEGSEEGDSDDMKLAWEMLEVARTICPNDQPLQLADVLSVLGDLGMETERFESAMTDYEQALGLLKSHLQADDRRIAEAHYKLSLTLHFLDNPEDGLKHARAAVNVCNARIAGLLPATAAAATAAAPANGAAAAELGPSRLADAPAAQDAALAAQREIADLKGVLEDLAAKVEELEVAVRENESTRNALKVAFSRLAAAQGANDGGSGGSCSAAAGAQPSGGVINLGVVGRGSKRINLQPIAAAGAPSTEGEAPKKRSLEDMMGSSAATAVGFGAPVSVPAGFGAAAKSTASTAAAEPAGVAAKKAKKELQERVENAQDKSGAGTAAAAKPAALPAFLQSSSVAAVYANGQQPKPEGQGQADEQAKSEGL